MPTRSPLTLRFGPLLVEYDVRVLVPRPWTLEQSTWAADLARERGTTTLLELCAGAGHIGLAAAVLADAALVQVELDPVAAAFAASNARRAGHGERVEIRVERLQAALREDEVFELIIADPPYLPSSTIGRWPEDPALAIDGGADGLDLLRACLDVAADHLPSGGTMLLQVAGPAQASQVEKLLPAELRAGEVRAVDPARAVMRIDHR